MFVIFRGKTLLILACILIIFISVISFAVIKTSVMPKYEYTIVIDAGHGGKDGGAVGVKTDVTESYLNLQYSLTLKNLCEQYGYKVILTRSDMNGLYSPLATNKKRSEMEKRREIIEDSNADIVVSIHMNSFPTSQSRGAQVFYAENSETGQFLADKVQESLNKNIEYAKKTAKTGDYYILNCTKTPSILIECGFLSNPEEEVLLQDENYMQNFCYQILCGLLLYRQFQ